MCFRITGDKRVKIKFFNKISSWERRANELISNKVILDTRNAKKLVKKKGNFTVYKVFNLWKDIEKYKNIRKKYKLNSDITLLRHGIFSPGKNGELFVTYGHIHEKFRGELYMVLKNSCFLMLTHKKTYKTYLVKLKSGNNFFISPEYFHRLVASTKDCVVLNYIPEDAGHNYEKLKNKGFPYHIFLTNGWYEIVKNPAYKSSKLEILTPKSINLESIGKKKLSRILFYPKKYKNFYMV